MLVFNDKLKKDDGDEYLVLSKSTLETGEKAYVSVRKKNGQIYTLLAGIGAMDEVENSYLVFDDAAELYVNTHSIDEMVDEIAEVLVFIISRMVMNDVLTDEQLIELVHTLYSKGKIVDFSKFNKEAEEFFTKFGYESK